MKTGESSHAPAGEASSAEASGVEYHAHDADTFSSLLWIPHIKHRVSYASMEVRWFFICNLNNII